MSESKTARGAVQTTDTGKVSEMADLIRLGEQPDVKPAKQDAGAPDEPTPEAEQAEPDADKPEPPSIDYDLVIPISASDGEGEGGESQTISQLKDHYQATKSFESDREAWETRQTEQENLKRKSNQILNFLTRHGYVYTDGNHWTQKHLVWLRSLEFDKPLLIDVFDNYFTQMNHCLQRLGSLDKQVKNLAESSCYKEIVGFLRCFHGIETLTAITVITEIFDFGRFSSPGQLMSYLGLTCSEDSSGQKQHKGPITKAGNKRVRRLMIECGWHYRHPCKLSKALRMRRNNQPQEVIDNADRAGQRLRKKYRHLINNGKMPCKVTVAIAKELVGFIWSIFNEYEARNSKTAY